MLISFLRELVRKLLESGRTSPTWRHCQRRSHSHHG